MPDHVSPPLWRRLGALIYDTCLVLPLVMLSVAIAMGVYLAVTGRADASMEQQMLPATLVRILSLATVAVFYCVFWLKKGQTLGMQAWRIRLRSTDGTSVTARQALLRCLGACVSLAVGGLGYWWCLFDRRGRYWHDYWSGTELELLPKT
ncbi:RDD family protein [Halieaceae bacterium IMCC14734]|uniref:RDD family protein n=1 Tax=Candidatus Litorirhabdus singularis TaxID=2518993 RepID=A0ABT3TJG9_9GAMM|nr:RDD family protein [Candidatus Litorirhabdus singularis]MCX2981916.1 RDD family protein [Candidatus Litorirhabdus singularis]